jgi:hypothetical protein
VISPAPGRGAVLLPGEIIVRRSHLIMAGAFTAACILLAALLAGWGLRECARYRNVPQVAFDFQCPDGSRIASYPVPVFGDITRLETFQGFVNSDELAAWQGPKEE